MSIRQVTVVGAGTMGSGIAQVCATARYDVHLVDVIAEQAQRAMKSIEQSLKRFVEKKRISEEVSTILGRIKASQSVEVCKDSEIVLEAVFENLSLKTDIFRQAEKFVSAHTILATNTSAISITEIGSVTTSPSRVVGIPFFSPVPMMQVAEVIRGMETSDETMDVAIQFVKSLGKDPIVVNRDVPGFLLNRINLLEEAQRMAEEISTKRPLAVAAAKKILDDGWDLGIEDGLDTESRIWGSLFGTKDQKEGAKAFLEKRSPQFRDE